MVCTLHYRMYEDAQNEMRCVSLCESKRTDPFPAVTNPFFHNFSHFVLCNLENCYVLEITGEDSMNSVDQKCLPVSLIPKVRNHFEKLQRLNFQEVAFFSDNIIFPFGPFNFNLKNCVIICISSSMDYME